MSMSKVKISYIWDEQNFNKLFNKAYNYQFKNSPRRYIGWLFIALAQFGVVAAFKKGSIAILLFSSILLIYWYYIKKILVKRRAYKEFLDSPLKDKRIELIVNRDGIEQGDTKILWSDIEEVVPIGDDILIVSKNRSYYIPSSGFESIEERSYFKSLAKEAGKLTL